MLLTYSCSKRNRAMTSEDRAPIRKAPASLLVSGQLDWSGSGLRSEMKSMDDVGHCVPDV